MSAFDELLSRLPAKVVIPTLTSMLGILLGVAGSTTVFAASLRTVQTEQAVARAQRDDVLRRLDRIESWQQLSNDKQDRMLRLLETIAVDKEK